MTDTTNTVVKGAPKAQGALPNFLPQSSIFKTVAAVRREKERGKKEEKRRRGRKGINE